eukprot:3743935-Prymnesium_polylepis.1
MDGPTASYSALEMALDSKASREPMMEPPIHALHLRSGGAITSTLVLAGAITVSSLWSRSERPRNRELPPDRTTFPQRAAWVST